jgi:transglutaminase-like putative cysteine protease
LVHGNQRVLSHRLEMSQPHSRKQMRVDRFGNVNFEICIPEVEEAVDFDVSLIVERSPGQGPHVEDVTRQALETYLLPSALTRPDTALRAVAAELACSGEQGWTELAIAVGGWVYRRMSYGFDRTGVRTTAGQALAAGHGVCQDYAHLMVALCRLLGIPARYVSGYLVGEGGTHAWVEVLQPLPGGAVEIVAWDPTHDRPADPRYLTVAVGRDYRDVAPVSGTYCGPHAGRLSTARSVSIAQERKIAA